MSALNRTVTLTEVHYIAEAISHNLYLDVASSQPHVGMIERFVKEVGAERVLFGSDMPVLEPAAQLGRVAYAEISEDNKEKILGRNVQQLLEVGKRAAPGQGASSHTPQEKNA